MKELTTAPESLFWYWISERYAIYLRRAAGQPKPWTTDPILRDYKFTNPFRENDRGTVWLRENFLKPYEHGVHVNCDFPKTVCSCGGEDFHLSLIAFNICWYRMFNWWGTGEFLGWQTDWDTPWVKNHLHERLTNGLQVFTGSHIVYSTPGLSKIDCIVDVCDDLWRWRNEIAYRARRLRSLERVFDALTEINCVGPFMAYEMVTDMRHTRLLEDAEDIMTWANPGPGAQRGLRRLGLPSKPDKAAIESMRQLLSRAPNGHIKAEEDPTKDLSWEYPVFEMRDIEHSLCEFDKYCRVKFGEGEPRSKFDGR